MGRKRRLPLVRPADDFLVPLLGEAGDLVDGHDQHVTSSGAVNGGRSWRPASTPHEASWPCRFDLLALTLAGVVLAVAAGLVSAAFAVLVGLAITLAGSVGGRFGARVAGGIAGIRRLPGTGRPGG
jgi:hypothetical protein